MIHGNKYCTLIWPFDVLMYHHPFGLRFEADFHNMNPTASDILEVLRKTEGYNLIANSLKRFIPHILRTNDSVIQTNIVDVFHQFQIPCDVKTIRSSCKKMKPQLMKMMRKIAKNAMLAYDKIDEVRKLYVSQTQTRKKYKSKLLEILNKN